MKNVYYAAAILLMIVILRKTFLDSTDSSEWRLYDGPRAETKMIVNVPVADTSVELPRFPGDVLLFSPIKKIPYVDINVLDRADTPIAHRIFITTALTEEQSLAYCYLRVLEAYRVQLPVRFVSKDINYDVSRYVKSDLTSFDLSGLSLDEMGLKDKKAFLSSISTQATRDTTKIKDPLDNVIIELSNGKATRYVWGYYLSGDYVYVVDPCSPQLSYARVNLVTEEYEVGTTVYKVRTYLRKLKVPITQEEGATP